MQHTARIKAIPIARDAVQPSRMEGARLNGPRIPTVTELDAAIRMTTLRAMLTVPTSVHMMVVETAVVVLVEFSRSSDCPLYDSYIDSYNCIPTNLSLHIKRTI